MKKINLLFLFLFLNLVYVKAQDSVMQKIMESIPSPVEISTLLKETGSAYQKSVLANPANVIKFNTEYKKAIALGIYSTDLGYSNIYGQSADAFGFLNGIKKLADNLKVGDLINMGAILKLAQSSNNLNALLLETSATFEKINARFQQNNQSHLSVAMLSAGWLETLYLMCNIAKQTGNKDLKSRIIEQRIILKELMLAIKEENKGGKLNDLNTQFAKLSTWFNKDKFNVKVTDGKTVVSDDDGIAVANGGEEAKDADLTNQELDEVFALVQSIRNTMK